MTPAAGVEAAAKKHPVMRGRGVMRVLHRGRLSDLLRALAIVSVSALVAAGCGSSDSSSTGSPSPSVGTATVAGVVIKADPALHRLLPASVLDAGQITVASDVPYPPWEMFVGDTGKITGFEWDLLQAIGAKLDIGVTFHDVPWDTAILSVQEGKNDIVVGAMTDSAEREKQVTIVDYAYDAGSILVRKGNPLGITNLDSLAGETVTCASGSTYQALLQNLNTRFEASGKKPMQLIILPTQPACHLAVQSERAVAEVGDHSAMEYAAMRTDSGNAFEVITDPAAPNGYNPSIAGAGISKEDPQLVTAFQRALQALIDDGAYGKIIGKYQILPVKSAQINVAGQAVSASPTP
jgi:polar amino acid transport system substrate-binding protein